MPVFAGIVEHNNTVNNGSGGRFPWPYIKGGQIGVTRLMKLSSTVEPFILCSAFGSIPGASNQHTGDSVYHIIDSNSVLSETEKPSCFVLMITTHDLAPVPPSTLRIVG